MFFCLFTACNSLKKEHIDPNNLCCFSELPSLKQLIIKNIAKADIFYFGDTLWMNGRPVPEDPDSSKIKLYKLIYLKQADSTYYYFLYRIAPVLPGKLYQGNGGCFRLDNEENVTYFEQLFETELMVEKKITETGLSLIKCLRQGNKNCLLDNENLEKPSERWQFVDSLNNWVEQFPP